MNAKRDGNYVPTVIGVSSVDLKTPTLWAIDPITHRGLVDVSGGISAFFQTDVFTSTNNQTIFTASENVAYTVGLYVNGSLQTPNVDYTETGGVYTLENGIPSGNIVVAVYVTS